MRNRQFFACTLFFLCGILLIGCNMNEPSPVEPAQVAPVEAVISTPTLSVPEGGTVKDPLFYVTASCPSWWGEYIFELRYSPPDLHIFDAGAFGFGGCTPFQDGAATCLQFNNPYLANPWFDFRIIYDSGAGVVISEPVSGTTPECPPYVPDVELASITCLPEGQVRFLISGGRIYYNFTTFMAACLGDEHCMGIGSQDYMPEGYEFYPLGYTFTGPAPTSSLLPLRFYYRFAGQPTEEDNYLLVIDDFYERYRAACPPPLPYPQPTATAEDTGGKPEPGCPDFTNYDACKTGGCYWWSNNTCNPSAEPLACSSYTTEKDCTSAPGGGCKWNGKSCSTP